MGSEQISSLWAPLPSSFSLSRGVTLPLHIRITPLLLPYRALLRRHGAILPQYSPIGGFGGGLRRLSTMTLLSHRHYLITSSKNVRPATAC